MTAADLLLSAVYILFAALSLFLGVFDARTHRLPNAIVLPATASALVLLAAVALLEADARRVLTAVAGGLALFAFYLVLRFVSPRSMGGGDVKLAGLVGLMLAWWGWSALALGALAGFVLGGLWGLALIATRRGDRRTRIAFGPFMLAGAWIAIVTAVVSQGALSSAS